MNAKKKQYMTHNIIS